MPANPPIIIGELDNVPAPGSPIASLWAQDVSTRVLQRFASVAERNALWPAPPDGAECVTLDTYQYWLSHAGAWVDATLSGPVGPAGPAGDPGEAGGSLLSAFWTFNATTTAPPAVGQVRSNAGMTSLYIHETDTDGFSRIAGLGTVVAGNTVLVRAQNGTALDLQVTGPPVDSGVYWTVPVATLRGSITKGARTQINFLRAAASGQPSADANNALQLGTDSLLYVRQLAYVVVKATAPVAADYGLASIPTGAVWIQS